MNRILAAALLATVEVSSSVAEVPEQARASIDQSVGSKGAYVAGEGVYKVVLPREEATMLLDYQTLSPNLGLNSWAAFTSAIHHEAIVTGQFLLLEDEVNAVLTVVLDAGLEVAGLAASAVFDGPGLQTLNVTGMRTFQDLASAFRKGLDEIRRVRRTTNRPSSKFTAPAVPDTSGLEGCIRLQSERGHCRMESKSGERWA